MFQRPQVSPITKRVRFGKIFTIDPFRPYPGYLFFIDDARDKHWHVVVGKIAIFLLVIKRCRGKTCYLIPRTLSQYSFGLDRAWISDPLNFCDICIASYTLKRAGTFLRCNNNICLTDLLRLPLVVDDLEVSYVLLDESFVMLIFFLRPGLNSEGLILLPGFSP